MLDSDLPIGLIGVETEYGLTVEGRGAEDQVEDAADFVRSYEGPCFVGWDYRHESPRADLRGFSVERLAVDPEDAQFDKGPIRPAHEVRSDRILPNGARYYNDHGHPEFATPECRSLRELALNDLAGEEILRRTANTFQHQTKKRIKVYKNNTDYHGASYGTHESFQALRALGFDKLFAAVVPVLVARQVLTGAGKVGSESGSGCDFQISQRADFFTEAANVETLFRRPVFNTRDEAHANPQDWIRLHVISGDANMMPECTMRKVGLVRLAVRLAEIGECPAWSIRDAVSSFKSISRDPDGEGKIELNGSSWTSPRHILEGLVDTAEKFFDDPETDWLIRTTRELLDWRFAKPDRFRRHVDWAAKRWLLDQFRDAEDLTWLDPAMQSLCLEYCSLDEDEGLYFGLLAADEVESRPDSAEIEARLDHPCEDTRALARSVAIAKFHDQIYTASWSGVVFNDGDDKIDLRFDPARRYSKALLDVESLGQFVQHFHDPS